MFKNKDEDAKKIIVARISNCLLFKNSTTKRRLKNLVVFCVSLAAGFLHLQLVYKMIRNDYAQCQRGIRLLTFSVIKLGFS